MGEIEKDELSDYGSNPIRMDFGNYTLGRLVKDRSNYDYEHDDYKKVRAQIYWRINDLGYSSKLFKEIDDEIEKGANGLADGVKPHGQIRSTLATVIIKPYNKWSTRKIFWLTL